MQSAKSAWLVVAAAAFSCERAPSPAASDASPTAMSSVATTDTKADAGRSELDESARLTLRECGARFDAKNGFDPACGAYARWQARALAPGDDAALVGMLAHGDAQTVMLAASALARGPHPYVRDATLADGVLTAAERSPNDAAAGALGYVASQIDFAATGLGARVVALLEPSRPPALRDGVVSYVLDANRASDLAYDATKALATDRAPSTRKLALEALSAAYGARAPDVCATWWTAFGVEDDDAIRASLAAHLTRGQRGHSFRAPGVSVDSPGGAEANACPSFRAKVLAAIDARASAGKLERPAYVDALRGVSDDADAPKPEKTRAIAIARAIVANKKNFAPVRVAAMVLLRDEDPDVSSFAKRYVDDPELKNAARVAAGAGR